MTRDELLARLTALAEADSRVLALLLGGSLGRGDGDRWSDLDLVAVVAPEDHPSFAEGARAWIEQAAPVVHGFKPFPAAPLFCAVTDAWLRCDLTVTVPGHVPGARDRLRPLLDRAGVWEALAPTLPPGAPAAERVSAIVVEFIRMLGLLPVGLGRGEFVVAQTGVGLQRGHLISLLIEELSLPQPPGALSLSRLLAAEDVAMLEQLPVAEANRRSVIAAQHAIAAVFLPRAGRLLERTGAPWPEAFWTATTRHLERELGDEWPGLP